MSQKRVLVIADVPGWAWDKKAKQLKQHLDGDEFHIDILYAQSDPFPTGYDLYHTFEVNQAQSVPVSFLKVTGITAHVWQTWEGKHGPGTVKAWASHAAGFHANSIMLQKEMEAYLGYPVFYVPNGVDETFYKRTRERAPSAKLVVGHVGKPNPRKGHAIIAEACEKAGVELRINQNTYKTAHSMEAMREFYQDLDVLAVASDFDGTPNPALEAAACGVAVISNPIGNMPEFIRNGENGILVERTVESMTNGLRRLAVDMPRTTAMGRAARATIEADWTWKKMSQHYAAMWRSVLKKSP